MTNLLVNSALTIGPQSGGRALFSAQPAAALSLLGQAGLAPRFEDALRGADAMALDLVGTSDSFVAFAPKKGEQEPLLVGDSSEPRTEDDSAQAQLALLPSIAPIPTAATAVTIPLAMPAVVSEAHVEIPASVAPTPQLPQAVANVASVAPMDAGLARVATDNLSLQLASLSLAATPSQAESAAAALSAATSAGGASSAARNGGADAVIAGAERSMMLLTAQAHAFAMPPTAKESFSIEAASQPGVAAKPSFAAVLGERLHVQIGQRSEHAVIRLDVDAG